MQNPQLSTRQKFPSIKFFREIIRENDLRKRNDIRFKTNYLVKCIMACRDHYCPNTVVHRSSIAKFAWWIANKLIDKFRVQPNMPLKAILRKVKDKRGFDLNNCQMYKVRRLAKDNILDKVKVQSNILWDYCETIWQTNRNDFRLIDLYLTIQHVSIGCTSLNDDQLENLSSWQPMRSTTFGNMLDELPLKHVRLCTINLPINLSAIYAYLTIEFLYLLVQLGP
jgi:hypothetical protein